MLQSDVPAESAVFLKHDLLSRHSAKEIEMTDNELQAVVAKIHELDPGGERMGMVLRNTLDQLYDGQHTGRYRWDQLHKTEKTHCGTLVEINLHREFQFADGVQMDYRIAGVDVDCKYSQKLGSWMIPMEAMGHLCLLVWANDETSKWSAGIVRIQENLLSSGGNRDSKRTITAAGRKQITWIFKDAPLSPNVLLQLPREVVDRIMKLPSGQQRVNEIFRVAQQQRIGRGVIATLGQQYDYMKRVRGNGGAREKLRPEGIIILGHYEGHARIAKALGTPVPSLGELVSVRVAPSEIAGPNTVELDGGYWRIATNEDPIVAAPSYPHR